MRRPDGTVRKTRQAYDIPGHAHELTFSCHKRLPLLSKDRTRKWFVESLDRARQRCDFALWAYMIMPEHVHLLLLPRGENRQTAALLKAIKQPIGRWAIDYLRVPAPDWLERLAVVRPSGDQRMRVSVPPRRSMYLRTLARSIHPAMILKGIAMMATMTIATSTSTS